MRISTVKFVCLALLALTASGRSLAAQTTVAIPNTVALAGVDRIGVNVGSYGSYQNLQLLRNENLANAGYYAPVVYRVAEYCANGGPTPNSTTSWYNNTVQTSSGTYPANFFYNGTYRAISSAGVLLGTGTVSGNTAQTPNVATVTSFSISSSDVVSFVTTAQSLALTAGQQIIVQGLSVGTYLNGVTLTVSSTGLSSTGFQASFTHAAVSSTTDSGPVYVAVGPTFSLSPGVSAACNPGDVLLVDQLNTSSLVSANTLLYTHTSGTTIETTDLDSASTNTTQALQIASGGYASQGFDASYPDSANTGSYVWWLDLNGTGYQATFKAKSLTSGATLTATFGRGSSYVNQTVTPTYNTTPGAGWQTYTYNFNPAETGAQSGNAVYYLGANNGTILVQDADVIEPSVYSGNTTPFRDAVYRKVNYLNPGSIRFMGPEDWCQTAASLWAAIGGRRPCGNNTYLSTTIGNAPMGVDAELQLAYAQNADAHVTVGNFFTAADMTTHISNIVTAQCSICGMGQTWQTLFAAKGLRIFTEMGNESWNSAKFSYLPAAIYGYLAKQEIAAARAVSGYSSAVNKLVVDGWGITSQATNGSGWTAALMTALGCTNATSTPALCPDYVDYAPYTFNNFTTLTSGSYTNSQAIYQDEVAETVNTDSTSSTSSLYNMKLAQSYLQSTYGVNAEVYEYSYSPNTNTAGETNSQLQQITSGVGFAMNIVEHALLMQRDALIPGPINFFEMGGAASGAGGVGSSWMGDRYLACGPGQLTGCADVSNAVDIAISAVNNAIGSNKNVATQTVTGTPTFSYSGGQGGSIPSNSAVPYVNTVLYCHVTGTVCDGTTYTLVAFNHNQGATETLTFSGAGAPVTGTTAVTQRVIGGSTNSVDQNNSGATVANQASYTPIVAAPTPSTATAASSYTLPAASMTVFTWNLGGGSSTPQPSTLSHAKIVNGSIQ